MQEGVPKFSPASDRAMRYVGLLSTLVMAFYSYLIVFGVIPSVHYADPYVSIVLSVTWIILSAYYFLVPPRSQVSRACRLINYHLIALATLVFITGFSQPFATLFILLFIATNLYFGRIGLILSLLSFVIAGVLDSFVRFADVAYVQQETFTSVAAILFLGITTVGLITAQETRRQTLLHSQARERLQYDRILTIINNLTDAAFSTNEKGTVLMYNAACLDLLDTNDSIKGKNIGELFNLSDSDKKPTNLFEILKETKKATRRDDINHTYTDGESIRLEINFAPIRSSYSPFKKADEQGGYIIIVRDVTKQKSLEEERDEFIGVVSHELRTPITIVEGTLSNLDVLIKRSQTPDPVSLAASINIAHDQVMYLAKMVNDLSTLSRAERGVADATEEIDVTDMMHSLHHRYQKEAETRKLHLNIDLGLKLGTVNVSRLYLEELLQNFITNALKYTKEGSVTLQAKRTKDTVHFTVKDTGIGMSRGDQAKVFNKFYRSEDYRIRETNGTGLGLYVCTKLANKLNTKVELKSRLNHGSSFSFELPTN
ncbi:MAG: putative Multi-sensor signal transduction histidine kinase [Candidatus Saccharibacteria bacterium]|nr:putative Multi-sensor signal transduction histidine kinase [Candidatus Saccharibacteria bacterium]